MQQLIDASEPRIIQNDMDNIIAHPGDEGVGGKFDTLSQFLRHVPLVQVGAVLCARVEELPGVIGSEHRTDAGIREGDHVARAELAHLGPARAGADELGHLSRECEMKGVSRATTIERVVGGGKLGSRMPLGIGGDTWDEAEKRCARILLAELCWEEGIAHTSCARAQLVCAMPRRHAHTCMGSDPCRTQRT